MCKKNIAITWFIIAPEIVTVNLRAKTFDKSDKNVAQLNFNTLENCIVCRLSSTTDVWETQMFRRHSDFQKPGRHGTLNETDKVLRHALMTVAKEFISFGINMIKTYDVH